MRSRLGVVWSDEEVDIRSALHSAVRCLSVTHLCIEEGPLEEENEREGYRTPLQEGAHGRRRGHSWRDCPSVGLLFCYASGWIGWEEN